MYKTLKKKTIPFIPIFFITVFTSSCFSYYPVSHNVMRVKEKNDISLSYSFDTNKFRSVSLAYGVTQNIALTGFYTHFNPEILTPGYFAGGSITGYTKLKKNIYPAIEIGLGYGRYLKGNTDFYFQYYKQYVQPSLGFSNNFFDLALSLKFTRINFHYAQLKEYAPDDLQMLKNFSYNISVIENSPYYLIELAPTIGIGYKFIKLRLQQIEVYKLGKKDFPVIDINLWIMLDVRYNLNNIPKLKRTSKN
jgi:hypothetical protein